MTCDMSYNEYMSIPAVRMAVWRMAVPMSKATDIRVAITRSPPTGPAGEEIRTKTAENQTKTATGHKRPETQMTIRNGERLPRNSRGKSNACQDEKCVFCFYTK